MEARPNGRVRGSRESPQANGPGGRRWARIGVFAGTLLLLSLPVPGLVRADPQAPGAAGGEGRGDVERPAEGSIAIPSKLPTPIPRGPREGVPTGDGGPGLDALLQLPSGYRARPSPSVAGADEAEWRRRFVRADRELASAREALASTKRDLDEVAEGGGASQWGVAPPGASTSDGPSTSPLSFKHRELMRQSREELEAAERAVRELKIEADLAGVPPAWRRAEAPGSSRGMPD